mmetsp:Transcript_2948/g.8759  ORF Transcript_2948/g.8759 Transcript_2948/m.8759 type:complete len:420 (-) Transcript_2948:152-1411(-)
MASPAPKFGLAATVGKKKKDEDRASVGQSVTAGGAQWAYYGLFDGHGGKQAADLCQAEFHDLVTKRAGSVRGADGALEALEAGVRTTCWELDERLGSSRIDAGTTATMLFVSPDHATVAWVGDSTGLVVDMLGRRDAWTTNNHNPQNLQEVARMKAEWGARREFLLFESPEGEDLSYADAMDLFTESYEVKLKKHMESQGQPPLRPHLIRDSMRRETKINERFDRDNSLKKRQSFESVSKFGKHFQPNDMDATIDMKRHDSNFTRRTDPNDGTQRGPVVVGANWHGRRPGTVVGGASTCVTRSIGDWDASRAVIPEPQTRSWPLEGAGDESKADDARFDRVILATDGLWDLVTFDAAEALVKIVDEPQQAADKLLRRAKAESARRGYQGLKDDTTILVIDLNPRGIALPARAGCACVLS